MRQGTRFPVEQTDQVGYGHGDPKAVSGDFPEGLQWPCTRRNGGPYAACGGVRAVERDARSARGRNLVPERVLAAGKPCRPFSRICCAWSASERHPSYSTWAKGRLRTPTLGSLGFSLAFKDDYPPWLSGAF